MIVCIGSRSASKIVSITSAFSKYPELWEEDEQVEYMMIPKEVRKEEEKGNHTDKFSGISCIPNGLDEILLGAKNRALNAFTYAKVAKRHL